MTAPDPTVITFDICGQICPSTLLTTLREVNRHKVQLQEGVVRLAIQTDNRFSLTTIPDAVRNMGYAVQVRKEQGHYLILIEQPGPTQ
jgi:TusA-related sulfurtransferase